MEKLHWIFWTRFGYVFLFLVFSLFLLGSMGIVFGQDVPKTEICNGIDDNGDGLIDDGVNCDHYLSYRLDKSIAPIDVVLNDQFISATNFQLVSIERLLNPVRKIHEKLTFNPKRPDLHYLAYRLGIESSDPFEPHSVFIENQFERRNVAVTEPRYLLSPTGKTKFGIPIDKIVSNVPDFVVPRLLAVLTAIVPPIPPIPQNANHYLCYDVEEPYDIGKSVFLKDQFQNRQFEVIRALYLCNPAEKAHGGKVSKIIDENNHLMCYEVIPHNSLNRQMLTHDQFGDKSLRTVQTEEICVPTVKTLLPPSCPRPDEGGTAALLDADTEYVNISGQLTIISPSPGGVGLTADALLHSGPDTVITRSGSPPSGETYMIDTEILQLTLSGGGLVLNLPVNMEIATSPRTPGDPVQPFDTDILQLQGQLLGDPDFDLLRITAGTGFGLPSPGHTTLTQLSDGNWAVDSFFDITYRIDFVGAPGGSFAGQSGSTTGTIRLEDTCSLPEAH